MSVDEKPIDGERRSLLRPILKTLSDAAMRFAGIRFIIVIPHGDRWEQISPSEPINRPEFCKLIQRNPDGAKQCKMCHILMSIAACSSGVTEQRCHAGVSVLVCPISSTDNGNVCVSVLSSCIFLAGVKQEAWKETSERGKRLGLRLDELKKAFDILPELTGEKLELARTLMRIAGEATMEIKTRMLVEQQFNEFQNARKSAGSNQIALQQQLREAMLISENVSHVSNKKNKKHSGVPAIIQVTADLVRRKSSMPFTVVDIAAAARMTPNHFSTLFHKHMHQNFSSFLTDARINAAKELLRNLSLNVGEVALKAGFEDPGYFTRRFRQKTGKTPREWRESL